MISSNFRIKGFELTRITVLMRGACSRKSPAVLGALHARQAEWRNDQMTEQ